MDPKLQSVIERVQKLLALSKSDNPNEAANAAAAANKLIDQYRLSGVDFTVAEEDPLTEDDGYIYETGRINPWKQSLIYVLATHYGCAYFNDIYFPEGRKVSRFKLTGRKSDIQIVRYMFSWLSSECQRLSDSQAKGMGKVYCASYCNGFVNGISVQLKASREEAKREATTEAIVKLDNRNDESRAFMYKKNPELRKVKTVSHSRTNVNAFFAGQAQGKSIHLGKALGGSD